MENAPLLLVFPSNADRNLEADVLTLEGYQVQMKHFDAVQIENVIRTTILDAEVPVQGANRL
jgi:hypothetical protein